MEQQSQQKGSFMEGISDVAGKILSYDFNPDPWTLVGTVGTENNVYFDFEIQIFRRKYNFKWRSTTLCHTIINKECYNLY